MKVYNEGKWLDSTCEELNLTPRDEDKKDFQEWRQENGFSKRVFMELGLENVWQCFIYKKEEAFLATIDYSEELFIEVYFPNEFSVLKFAIEHKEFFKNQTAEYVQADDGRWIKVDFIKTFWCVDSYGEKQNIGEYTFFCQTKDGEEYELDTVNNRAYYMKHYFGFTIYA